MAKTNAQRQADYRVRHFNDEGKGKHLNLVRDLHWSAWHSVTA
jgi:hypothetical protein